MFRGLEKAFGKVLRELGRLEEAMRTRRKALNGEKPKRVFCKISKKKTARKTVSVRQYKRQRGLSDGILKALEKKAPAKVNDITGMLPGFGYKVRDERKTKLAVFQTLHRMLKVRKVERSGRGEYKLAG